MNDPNDTKYEWRKVGPLPAQQRRIGLGFFPAALPFAVAAFFLWSGRMLFGWVIAGIGLLLLVLRFAAPHFHESILTRLAAFGKWFGRLVSHIMLTLVYALLFTPLALVARLTRRDPLSLSWRPGSGSYWTEVPRVGSLRLFNRPFMHETQHIMSRGRGARLIRLGRALYQTAVALFIFNLAAGYLYRSTPDKEQTDGPDPQSQLAVYKNVPWAEDYFEEVQRVVGLTKYEPFVMWGSRDFHGRYVNIKAGLRRSYKPATDVQDPLRLYVFGGSTVWGWGARDDYTIPSQVARMAMEEGVSLNVTNLGGIAYSNWQNVLRLVELCAQGKVPDAVIFYEGANDVAVKMEVPALNRAHFGVKEWRRRPRGGAGTKDVLKWFRDHSLVHQVVGSTRKKLARSRPVKATPLQAKKIQRFADEIATTYAQNAQLIAKLARAYGFEAWCFWQPAVYTKNPVTPEESSYMWAQFGEQATWMIEVYRAVTEKLRSQDSVLDLSAALDNVDKTLFMDWCHLTEEGNRMVAKAMLKHILPGLQSGRRGVEVVSR